MILRFSRSEDQLPIKKLIESIFQNFVSSGNGPLFNWPDEKVNSLLIDYQFIVLESDESRALMAFVCFQKLGDDFEIIALGVDPSAQGRGIMTQLIQFFVENICTVGSKVYLEVHEKNQRALAFYKKVGFQIDGLRKGYYSDGGSALNMSLSI